MKKQDIYKFYKNEFKFLTENEFVLKDKERYIQNTSYGFNEIDLLINDYKTFFIIRYVLCIRIDVLENIMNLFSDIGVEGHSQSNSIILRQEELAGVERKEYKISSDEDLINMQNDFHQFMDDFGWKFFMKYYNIDNINKEINESINEPCLLYDDKCTRAMYGILVAKINNSSNFDSLVVQYRNSLKDWNQYDRERYEKLVQYLIS